MENWEMTLLAGMVAAGGAILWYVPKLFKKKIVNELPQKVKRDWLPTGSINFIVPDDALGKPNGKAVFFLEIEEDRIIEMLGGGTKTESRFRLATLDEAKKVVQCYDKFIENNPDEGVSQTKLLSSGPENYVKRHADIAP